MLHDCELMGIFLQSVGVGSMDVMITKVVVEAAIAKGIGQYVDF